jgi:DNA-binding CsgD family transcriptional regulator
MRSAFQPREGVRYHPAALIIMKQKKRISKTESVKQILKLLRKGYATTDITREIASKYDIHEATVYAHLKIAKEQYQDELERQQKEIEMVRLAEAKKVAKKGLKSKFERDLEIQEEIEHYQSILAGDKKVSFILGQKVSATENLPIQIVLLVQNTINDLRKELAKRLGEYEATTIRVEEVKPDVTYITLSELRRNGKEAKWWRQYNVEMILKDK